MRVRMSVRMRVVGVRVRVVVVVRVEVEVRVRVSHLGLRQQLLRLLGVVVHLLASLDSLLLCARQLLSHA